MQFTVCVYQNDTEKYVFKFFECSIADNKYRNNWCHVSKF